MGIIREPEVKLGSLGFNSKNTDVLVKDTDTFKAADKSR